jgi:hypothetical protein
MDPSLQMSASGMQLCWQHSDGHMQSCDVVDVLSVEAEANVLLVHHFPAVEVRIMTCFAGASARVTLFQVL